MAPKNLKQHSSAAFTKIELLVVVGVVLVLGVLLYTNLRSTKHVASEIDCSAKLMHQGGAFSAFANDHNDLFPASVSTNTGGSLEYADFGNQTYRHFQSLSNMVDAPSYLVCPTDKRQSATAWNALKNENLSYFVAVNARRSDSGCLLAGDRNLTTRTNIVVDLATEKVQWEPSVGLHEMRGNILFGDGSVRQLDSIELKEILQSDTNATNRLSIP